ncbi:ribulokinase [Dactylosporangium aurantiacum]|uniref:Ribulokinase n=1 Tax=Dactylosporangium aurantiacum TaxID=35754 RepID=A0A9Q9MGL2_9ACTN|nr:ribulokinase [Dactylosporangium aurantiacum]MDG6105249.1 ribulokinase [Dactylosporangium aurantiacum]UWZ51761.1 ribulokinase [Dactylosporangium aurantiacum]
MTRYVVGVDFGTLSGRAVVVRVADGVEVGTAVHEYRHGAVERTLPATGEALPPHWALQMPLDWVDVLRNAVPAALASVEGGLDATQVVGIATDFTACTFLPVLADGTPLSDVLPDRPHAYPKLWKHHAAQRQADRINRLAEERGEAWLARYGGKLSAEWQFAKALQVLEEDPEVFARAERFVEAADWIVWQLTGVETRNACTAGYKGAHQDGRYPSRDYFEALHPGFGAFLDKVEGPLAPLGGLAGRLTAEAAAWTGLPEGIAVAVGNVDAHVTAPAAQAVEAGQLVAIMGTSTCHVMSGATLADVPGMCGVVADGIVPGLYGYEAGQSGVGDIFGWFVDTQLEGGLTHEELTARAAQQRPGQHGLVALDWHNGNRSVLVDHHLSGVIVGQTLATRPEDQYRALIEATAYGTRTIVETLEAAGVPVTEFIAAGGLLKNTFLMQVYSDVLRRPISVIDSEQGPALGSAIHAAVAAGEYPDVRAAAAAMGKVKRAVYTPDEAAADVYDRLYAEYRRLHDYFGRSEAQGANEVLHRLRELREEVAR